MFKTVKHTLFQSTANIKNTTDFLFFCKYTNMGNYAPDQFVPIQMAPTNDLTLATPPSYAPKNYQSNINPFYDLYNLLGSYSPITRKMPDFFPGIFDTIWNRSFLTRCM